MDNSELQNNIMSFIFGIILAIMFWYSFKPRYIIVKNNSK